MPTREDRLAENEAAARAVNEEHVERRPPLDGGFHRIICECADPSCTTLVTATPSEYRMARRDPRRFIIACGHEVPDIERVVYRHDRYCLVEKLDGPP